MFLRKGTQNTRESILQWVKDATSSSCVQPLVSKSFPKQRSDHGFRFDLKNLAEVWIQRIHDPFLDFSKKKTT